MTTTWPPTAGVIPAVAGIAQGLELNVGGLAAAQIE